MPRLRSLAALAALMLAAGSVGAQPAPACQVAWTGMTRFTYDEGRGSAVVLRGSHSLGGPTTFGVTDDDGFLTLAVLLNQWRADGRAAANATERVTLRRDELELALQAARIGLAYQAGVVRGMGGAASDEDGDSDARSALERQEYMRLTVAELRRLIALASPSGVTVPKGFIRARFAETLERFAPGAANSMEVYYFDYGDGQTASQFCRPGQKNRLVGEVLCSRNFVTGAARAGTPCPDGVALNDLAAAPVCEGVLEGGKLVDGACARLGAPRPPANQPPT